MIGGKILFVFREKPLHEGCIIALKSCEYDVYFVYSNFPCEIGIKPCRTGAPASLHTWSIIFVEPRVVFLLCFTVLLLL